MLNAYEDQQMKLINSSLVYTNDNWQTCGAAVGSFEFYNPKTKQTETGYGVIAKQLIGNVLLGENIGIYNKTGTMEFDENGLSISNGTNTFTVDPNKKSLLSIKKGEDSVFSVTDSGDLSYTGEVHAQKLIIADEGLKQENSNNSLVISQSNNSILTLSDKEKKVLYFDENNILNFVGNATINKLTLKNSDFVQVGTILGNSSQNINSSSSSFSVSSTGMLKTNNSVLYNSQILNKKNNFYSGFLNGDISLFIGADDENGTNAIFSVENSGIVKNIKVRDPWDTQSNVVTCDNDSKINIKYVDEYIEFYDETTLIAKIKNGYGI